MAENSNTGIIFDLDGTLWDPTLAVRDTWNSVFSRKGETLRLSKERVDGLMGKTMQEIAAILFPERSEAEREGILYECGLEEIVYLGEHGGTLYTELEETLSELKKQGFHLSIVSNCQEHYVEAFFRAHGLADFFNDFEESGRTGKAKGENIRLVMERNGLSKAVYIGDTEGDERAANLAGIPFIHAAYGLGRAENPDAAIKSLSELAPAVKRVLCDF